MKLVIGLGNIGAQYAATRHNVGFMVVDELAQRLSASWHSESKFKAEIAEANLEGERVILAKPQTMMNLSGEAAAKIAHFYKLDPVDMWAVFDDVDTPFGRLRLRIGGSGSGHQGVNSLIRHLEPGFVRVKVGISLNDRTKEPSEVYVLKPFNADERPHLPEVIGETATTLQHQLLLDAPEETTVSLLA